MLIRNVIKSGFCLGSVLGSLLIKAMRNWEIYAIPFYVEFRNSGIPDDGNLTEIYCTSVNPELRVNVTELRNFRY